MTDRERFLACMTYQPVDRVPFWSWGGWEETIERWKNEGYDPNTYDIHIGSDRRIWWGGWFYPDPPFEFKVVEEDEDHILYINHEGILMREMKAHRDSSMPQFVKFPVETREEFRAFWKERMQPNPEQRIGPGWQDKLRRVEKESGLPIIVAGDRWGGFFGPQRNMVGVQKLCTLFYDDPAFVEEMMDANADFTIELMSKVLDVIPVDCFVFWEDMAYKSAPLISPAMARKYMLPRYKRVVDYVKSRGVEWIALDSDGQIDTLIPIWMDAGINTLYPFEVQCGMDVLRIRREYGRDLRMWGGVDKRVLHEGPAAIDAELDRLRPLMREGGFIPHTDHSAPPDVSFSNYCYYMKRVAEVCANP